MFIGRLLDPGVPTLSGSVSTDSKCMSLMPQMTKVLHVISTMDYSGAPRGVVELINEQLTSPYVDPFLLIIGTCDRELPDSIRARLVGVLGENISYRKPLQFIKAVTGVRRATVDSQVDIVHSHLPAADILSSYAVVGTKAKLITHIRSTPDWLAANTFGAWYRRRLARVGAYLSRPCYVAVSKAAADYYEHHLVGQNGQVRVVLNGIDMDRYGTKRTEAASIAPLVILSAGRLVPSKNFVQMIEVLAELRALNVDAVLRIAGQGSQLPVLQRRAADLGLSEKVSFVGNLPDMEEFYASGHLFLFLSINSEGLPRVLMEASAAGLAVVTSDTCGARELYTDESCGIVLESCKTDGIVGVLSNLLSDPVRLQTMGAAGARHVREGFTARRVARQFESIYREMVQ